MKKIFLVFLLALFSLGSFAQNFSYKWSRVEMNSSWEGDGKSKVDKIVARYQPGMEALMEIVCYSDAELSKNTDTHSLANLAADIILDAAAPYAGDGDRMFSMTNYGGIRTELPKGAIRVYDVYSVFPFDNYIVVVDILGKDVRKMFEKAASQGRFEALGGVEIVTNRNIITKCNIGGAPIEDDRVYKLATIDFLLDGGDSQKIRQNAIKIQETGIVLRDAVVNYLRRLMDEKMVLTDKGDDRILYINSKSENE